MSFFSKAFTPEMLKKETQFIRRCERPPVIACFETACAFQLWLAWHGQNSKIHIGKRIDKGKLEMHAWVSTKTGVFFYAPGFEEAFLMSKDNVTAPHFSER